MRPLAALLLLLPLGCLSSAQKTAFTGAFVPCAKADVGLVIGTLEGDVAAVIATGVANVDAGLAALGVNASIDAIDCAIAGVEAMLKAGQVSAAPSTAEPAWVAAVAEAHAWVARQRAMHAGNDTWPPSVTMFAASGVDPETADTAAFWGRPDPITAVGAEQHR
jgi:hypothetical protein